MNAYWRDPVQVMTGLAWMLVGLMMSAAVRADRIEREWFCKRCGNSVHKLQGSWAHIRNQHSPKSCGRKLTDNDVYRLPPEPNEGTHPYTE
jgi:hypothetical protein